MGENQLDQLVEAILVTPKYKNVHQELVRRIGSQELVKRRNLKEAIKTTKKKLHQVGGAYLAERVNYAAWLEMLQKSASSGNKDELLQVCQTILKHQSSTAERLPILNHFYATILADIPPIHKILDIACGLNPISIPWMPLAANAEYYAYDIYHDMMDFIGEFIKIIRLKGHAQSWDVSQCSPPQKADVALLLKALPCLEQIDKSVSARLLNEIQADYIVVSFPARSLGGKSKGMDINYEARFWELVANKNWSIKRFAFSTELVFLVTKQPL